MYMCNVWLLPSTGTVDFLSVSSSLAFSTDSWSRDKVSSIDVCLSFFLGGALLILSTTAYVTVLIDMLRRLDRWLSATRGGKPLMSIKTHAVKNNFYDTMQIPNAYTPDVPCIRLGAITICNQLLSITFL